MRFTPSTSETIYAFSFFSFSSGVGSSSPQYFLLALSETKTARGIESKSPSISCNFIAKKFNDTYLKTYLHVTPNKKNVNKIIKKHLTLHFF